MTVTLTRRPSHQRLRHAARDFRQLPGLPFERYLPAQRVNQAATDAGHKFRQRLFDPAFTLWTWLSQALDSDASCLNAVSRVVAFLAGLGVAPRREDEPCSSDTSAYCQARKRLPEEVPARLTRQTGRELHAEAPPCGILQGRPLKVADGTGLSMADTPANQEEFPKNDSYPEGVGFPLMRLVVIFSIAAGTVLDAAFGKFQGEGTGELSLFRKIDDVLQPGDILVGDRLYSDFWDVARAYVRGIDVVMRQHAGREEVWFRGRGHSKRNRRTWWKKPPKPDWMSEEEYASLPVWLQLRAVRVDVKQKGFRPEKIVLVTTLLDDAEYPAEEIAEAYQRRWDAELDLRSLKSVMGMDVLAGKTPAMVRKEVWIHLLAYNVVRRVMLEAAKERGYRPEEVSFKGALQTFLSFAPKLESAGTEEEVERLRRALLRAVGRHRVRRRPNRYEPRKVRRQRTRFPRLSEPRSVARLKLRKRIKEEGKKR